MCEAFDALFPLALPLLSHCQHPERSHGGPRETLGKRRIIQRFVVLVDWGLRPAIEGGGVLLSSNTVARQQHL